MNVVTARFREPAVGKTARDAHYDTLLRAPARLVDAGTGQTVLVTLKADADLKAIRRALRTLAFHEGGRTSGMLADRRAFGYMPRVAIRNDYCRRSPLSQEQPSQDRALTGFARVASRHYREELPEQHAAQLAEVQDKILPAYRLHDTPFTSGIANRNSPLHYHRDTGNFPGRWSVMLTLRAACEGGALVLPNYGVAAECADGDLTMFDGQSVLHGVTALVRQPQVGYRFSVVYYALKQLWLCEEPRAELRRAQGRRDLIEQRGPAHRDPNRRTT